MAGTQQFSTPEPHTHPYKTGHTPFMSPKSLPPSLLGYIRQLFFSHDKDGSGALGWDEFWWTLNSLGLGLTDDDIHGLMVHCQQ